MQMARNLKKEKDNCLLAFPNDATPPHTLSTSHFSHSYSELSKSIFFVDYKDTIILKGNGLRQPKDISQVVYALPHGSPCLTSESHGCGGLHGR